MLRLILVLSILQVSNTCLFGQKTNENIPPQARPSQQITGDSTNKTADSLRNETLFNQSSQLQELETRRIIDSARQSELQQQLKGLQSSESSKRQALQTELDQVRGKEAERLLRKKQKIDSLRAFVKGFPVAPFDDTLFFIYARLGSFSPRERATAVTLRIRNLADDYFFAVDSLKQSPAEQTTDIAYGENIITSISDNDALWMNTSRQELATGYREKIGQAVGQYKEATSWQKLLKDIGLALLVIGLLAAIIYFISRLFRISRAKILAQVEKKIKGIRIKNYLLFDAKQEGRILVFGNAIVKWALILVVIYLALPALFAIFPWTKGFATTLLNYFLGPAKRILRAFWNYLPNLFTIIVIVIIFRYLLKGLNFLKKEVARGALRITGFYPDWANPTYQIIRVLAFAFILIVIFPYLPGSGSPIFKGVSVFLGVLFTFGSAGALGNIIAGLVLTYVRAFKIGDRVRIGDATGDIVERSLLVTRIRTIKNEIISIPNSMVMGNTTTNFSSDASEKGLIIHTTVTIGYDNPWRQIHELLINAALATEHIEKQPAPFVLQTSLDDYYVSYQVNAYTREPNRQAETYSLLHQQIQDKFFEAGVEIMSPHYKAVRDGNSAAIPPDYLPKDYTAPSFNVKNQADGKKDI
jgi:small-conductance mechanosensitive channel